MAGNSKTDHDKCENCIYFHSKFFRQSQGYERTCRRNPPTVQGQPHTDKDSWCGEHRRITEKEAK